MLARVGAFLAAWRGISSMPAVVVPMRQRSEAPCTVSFCEVRFSGVRFIMPNCSLNAARVTGMPGMTLAAAACCASSCALLTLNVTAVPLSPSFLLPRSSSAHEPKVSPASTVIANAAWCVECLKYRLMFIIILFFCLLLIS